MKKLWSKGYNVQVGIYLTFVMLFIYVKNWLDPVIKQDYSTLSVIFIIKNTLTFIENILRNLLHTSSKQNLN